MSTDWNPADEYQVDRAMIGDAGGTVDLRLFCERLTAETGIRCIPVLDSWNGARNADTDLIDDATFFRILHEVLS